MKMRLATVALMAVVGCLPAMAAEVRPADEIEMLHHIRGCWELERSASEIEDLRKREAVAYADICFEGEGRVTMSIAGGSLEDGLEGRDAGGEYEVTGRKLRLHADGYGDGWFLGRENVECDVVIRPGVAIKLLNCSGTGLNMDGSSGIPEALSDTSYARRETDKDVPEQAGYKTGLPENEWSLGCWIREPMPADARLQKSGITIERRMCLGAIGEVTMVSTSTNTNGVEELVAKGAYRVEGGKLRLSGSHQDGWLFDRPFVICDQRLEHSQLYLDNCLGAENENFAAAGSTEKLRNTSYLQSVGID